MKKLIISTAILIASTGSYAQRAEKSEKVVIDGVLSGDLKGHNKIYLYTRLENDSAEIGADGHYHFELPFAGVTLKMLFPEYIGKEGKVYRPFGILIDRPGTYRVNSDIGKGMYASTLRGPEAMLLYQQFGKDQDEAYLKINKALEGRFGNNWWNIEEKDPRYAEKQTFNDSLQKAYVEPILERMLKDHPDSYASAFVLAQTGQSIQPVERQEALYDMLSARMKATTEGKKFYDFIEGIKNSAIGKQVADFTLSDPQGNPVNFGQFKGKYVMIDFWASWCVPCRKSFPTMRRIYQQYKDKGFEIYSISIDESKKAWLKAVGEENNPWAQALDNQDISHKGFAITGVPTTYLIDPQGKIVAKQVGFDEDSQGPVEEKLASMYGALSKAAAPADAKQNGRKSIPAAVLH